MILDNLLQKLNTTQKFIAVVVIQVVFLFLIIAIKSFTVVTGETVLLKVVPVDPYDLLRGEYVNLRYDISEIDLTKINNDLDKQDANSATNRQNYISLKMGDKGYFEPTFVSGKRPTNGIYIASTSANRISNSLRLKFGIESYFVEQGQGKQIEKAINTKEVLAKVKVDRYGNAVIEDLIITDKPVVMPTPTPTTKPIVDTPPINQNNPKITSANWDKVTKTCELSGTGFKFKVPEIEDFKITKCDAIQTVIVSLNREITFFIGETLNIIGNNAINNPSPFYTKNSIEAMLYRDNTNVYIIAETIGAPLKIFVNQTSGISAEYNMTKQDLEQITRVFDSMTVELSSAMLTNTPQNFLEVPAGSNICALKYNNQIVNIPSNASCNVQDSFTIVSKGTIYISFTPNNRHTECGEGLVNCSPETFIKTENIDLNYINMDRGLPEVYGTVKNADKQSYVTISKSGGPFEFTDAERTEITSIMMSIK